MSPTKFFSGEREAGLNGTSRGLLLTVGSRPGKGYQKVGKRFGKGGRNMEMFKGKGTGNLG